MAGRVYNKMTIEQFGAHLLQSGDLDPIYIALHRMERTDTWGVLKKHRWLLAYWCFYDAGIASYLSERKGEEYWRCFSTAAANAHSTPAPIGNAGKVNGGWPRGKERRHFRGIQAIKATNELIGKYTQPEFAFNHLVRENDPARLTFATVKDRVTEWRGFGDWISFKVGDMLDRCGVCPVDFAFDDAMYKDPTQAALMQWKVWHQVPAESTIDDEKAAVQEVVNRLISYFGDRLATPLNDRPIGYQEVETILCKWKSHVRGHYPLYNDIDEIGHGVAPWAAHSETARLFLSHMPTR